MLPLRVPPFPCKDAATRIPTSRPSNQAPCRNPKYSAELASPANQRFSTLARRFWCLSSVTPTGQLLYEPNDHLRHPSGQPRCHSDVSGKTDSLLLAPSGIHERNGLWNVFVGKHSPQHLERIGFGLLIRLLFDLVRLRPNDSGKYYVRSWQETRG